MTLKNQISFLLHQVLRHFSIISSICRFYLKIFTNKTCTLIVSSVLLKTYSPGKSYSNSKENSSKRNKKLSNIQTHDTVICVSLHFYDFIIGSYLNGSLKHATLYVCTLYVVHYKAPSSRK